MDIPNKIKIGGHWFDIQLKTEKDGYDRQGSLFRWWNRIIIQSDLAQSKKETALFHEVLHEISGQMDIGLNEMQVSILSECIYQFLIDNELLKLVSMDVRDPAHSLR